MRKLMVGDQVVRKTYIGNTSSYLFSDVVRLTSKRAILKNGIQLINECHRIGFSKLVGYTEYGGSFKGWQLATPELREEAEAHDLKQKKIHWFNSLRLTNEQKVIIYDKCFGYLGLDTTLTEAKND